MANPYQIAKGTAQTVTDMSRFYGEGLGELTRLAPGGSVISPAMRKGGELFALPILLAAATRGALRRGVPGWMRMPKGTRRVRRVLAMQHLKKDLG